MRKNIFFSMLTLTLTMSISAQDRIKEYEASKVSGTPPVIDGEFTEEEWAGSVWRSDFTGLRNGAVGTAFQGADANVNWRWRALWDDEYLYFLFEAELLFLNPNGVLWDGSLIDPLSSDDTGFAGWGVAQNVDMEVFLEPNWQAGDEFNSNPPDFTENYNEEGAANTYQFIFFPLKEDREGDTVFAPTNFGVRDKQEGPPFLHSGLQGGVGDWVPFFDPTEAEANGVEPMLVAALPHEIDGAVAGSEVVARPVLEVGFPFSQFTAASLPDVIDELDLSVLAENLLLIQNADGTWVNPGDEWLINVCAYTDNVLAETGLSLITWNDNIGGGFNTYPRGILRFVEGTAVDDWSLHE